MHQALNLFLIISNGVKMFKKSLFFMLVSSCMATSSFAINPLHQFEMIQKKSLTIAAKNNTVSESQKYTDFSGTWTGNCPEYENEPTTFTIKNDSMNISFDSEEYSIGSSLKTDSRSNAANTSFLHMSFEWNNDKSQLNVNDVGVMKGHLGEMDSSLLTQIGHTNLSISNEQLIISGKMMIFSGSQQTDTLNMTCIYKKN